MSYYQNNKEKIKARSRERYEKIKETDKYRKQKRDYMRKRNKTNRCKKCSKIIWKPSVYCIDCAKTEVKHPAGKNHPHWNFKDFITRNGYRFRKVDGKYIAEHISIWQENGGTIPKDFVIHHINGNKLDNRIENLACIHKYHHNVFHHLKWEEEQTYERKRIL